MKARYTSENGRLVFDVEAETAKALFSQLGAIQELFEAETQCGLCNSSDIRYSARVVDEYEFYELACRACKAQFRFGQKKKGGDLFPKRKDDDGNWLANKGWSRFEPQSSSPPVPPIPTGNRPINPATPNGLQPSFDRLGELLNKPAPTRLGPALDMLREAMHTEAGPNGTAQFDALYRNFEAKRSQDPKVIKAFLAEVVAAWQELGIPL